MYSDGCISISFTHSSITSSKQHESSIAGAFRNWAKINSTFSSPTSKVSFPFLTSIMAPAVAKNGLTKIMCIFESYLMSIITKSVGI